jgi:hypothetical protein
MFFRFSAVGVSDSLYHSEGKNLVGQKRKGLVAMQERYSQACEASCSSSSIEGKAEFTLKALPSWSGIQFFNFIFSRLQSRVSIN